MISTIAASDEVDSCDEADSENTAGNNDIGTIYGGQYNFYE